VTTPPETIDWVERLHGVVDELVAPVVAGHGARLRCRSGCNDCCSDGLSVFAIEAAVIERHHERLLAEGTPHREGACAFLDETGACRIYAQRPYVCRTQGLPLRWLESESESEHEHVEVRDICPLNADGAPLEELQADECWTLGPVEERLGSRQAAVDGGAGERVPLRSLFEGARRRLPVVR
jgi:Fe-S-cluster containining protein